MQAGILTNMHVLQFIKNILLQAAFNTPLKIMYLCNSEHSESPILHFSEVKIYASLHITNPLQFASVCSHENAFIQ